MAKHVPIYGVRKGAWSAEEDALLRKCIEKYGEGKWHQVPLKAGLNRCRKSCRLRWLNYLRPNIKRGEFTLDEVDLLIRLHKLLGNRWSLIAGRLPGRTANDVKNYWNTHLRKKMMLRLQVMNHRELGTKADQRTKVIKPRPRTFSKSLVQWMKQKAEKSDGYCTMVSPPEPSQSPVLASSETEEDMQWWKNLLDEADQFFHTVASVPSSVEEERIQIAQTDKNGNWINKTNSQCEERWSGYQELSFDIELSDFVCEEWENAIGHFPGL